LSEGIRRNEDDVRHFWIESQSRTVGNTQGKAQIATKEFPWKTAFQIATGIVLLLCGYLFGNHQSDSKNQMQMAFLQQEAIQLKQDMMLTMLDNKSASKRIQAVGYTSEIQNASDTKIENALIERLNFDGNVNVRLAAAEALSKYSETDRVKTAFIKALSAETNPTVQISLMQFLVENKDQRARAPMEKLLNET